ncbi:MAG: CRISPR-associated protein Cas6 [Bacteroidetes bacterium]|nr:MAG: CRISPR-associated protein Cas6 [Bacteroidota bacterium]REJ99679.1 MAG: CRISPR-associated protein Cas6 [Bacteroidota bacterium]REK33912.1 MAG: CRISPR-associated protein Cas6 [Bacteroidota bacterium]REK47677.1 MAG: CRISPR-associated protein Cas6 [Bacteroidota bacterium]
MRIKISFLKVHGSSGTVPLHHQKIISAFLEEVIRELPVPSNNYNFSSLKGTSKVQAGQIRFLSSKVSLVLSAPEQEFIQQLVDKIFEKRLVSFAKLTLVPKSFEVIPDPEFKTQMKYVCISPMVPQGEFMTDEAGNLPEATDPRSHEFSDMFYDSTLDRMEKAGFTEEQISQFAEFEIIPDPVYVQKIADTHKKFARIYKNNLNQTIYGYLIPFTLHAHPQVQKFVWECGMGLFTTQGYGMVDVVGGVSGENPSDD